MRPIGYGSSRNAEMKWDQLDMGQVEMKCHTEAKMKYHTKMKRDQLDMGHVKIECHAEMKCDKLDMG